jgi:hypothetical protein
MGDLSMKRINITQAAAVIGVAGLLGVALPAIAGDKKPAVKPAAPAYTDPASLLKFDHVVVVNATPAQRAAAAAETRKPKMAAQKAYIDSSGNIRPVTSEDLRAEAAAASAPAVVGEMITTASGGHAMLLDDSSNVYSVATIGSDGKVKKICVDAPIKNKAALQNAANAAQENDHEE